MFSVYNSEVVGLEPAIDSECGVLESGTQSEDITTAHSYSQSVQSHSIGVQTTEVESVASSQDNVASPALLAFLGLVTPVVLDALNEEFKVDLSTPDETDHELDRTMYLQSLDCVERADAIMKPESGEGDRSRNDLLVVALTWNSTGNVLAVGLSRRHDDQEPWCQQSGLIQFYKLERSDENKWEFSHSLSTEGCVEKLQYHPKVPCLLAYSNNSGEVYVYNVGDVSGSGCHGDKSQTNVNAASKLCDSDTDLSAVTDFKWLTPQQADVYVEDRIMYEEVLVANDEVLMTMSHNGELLSWRISATSDHIPDEPLIDDITMHSVISDITCFDIDSCESPMSPALIVMGCMSGDIILYSLQTKKEDFQIGKDDYGTMENKFCCILALKLRPDCVISLSADREIKIYHFNSKHSDTYRMATGPGVAHMCWDRYSNQILVATAKFSDQGDHPQEENVNLGRKSVKILTVPWKSFQSSNIKLKKEDVELSTSLMFNNNRNMIAVGENRGGVHIFSIKKTY